MADTAPASSSSEPKADEASGVTRSILRQIEYYFSDSNFPKDKFLMAEVAKSEEGWVDLTIITNFNKVKGLVPTMDIAIIADALRHSNILEVNADATQVRRPGLVKKNVKLGELEFSSREEVVTHARSLIAEGGAAENGAISADGQAFVTGLLELHDKAAEKKGDGEFSIKVGKNPQYPDTSCFVIVRADGSEVRARAQPTAGRAGQRRLSAAAAPGMCRLACCGGCSAASHLQRSLPCRAAPARLPVLCAAVDDDLTAQNIADEPTGPRADKRTINPHNSEAAVASTPPPYIP